MDLLDRIDALTDDQLRAVAERDDASGVLAAYRLSERRGLPYPEREAVVLGDGYVIVAQNGQVQKLPVESISKIIQHNGSQYCVYSEDGQRSFGCYDTLAEAEARLQEIHVFRAEKATRREEGEDFPPEAFAYVPDPETPSTWKLRLWDSLEEKETRSQVGRAIAALSPAGFRGNRVEIPAEDLPGVKRRVAAAWRKVWGDDETAELPTILKESFKPPAGVQQAAQRALDWLAEGHAGSGFTDVGRARAAQLARGDAVSEETIRRMSSYLARHKGDSSAEGFNAGEDGFPSPGRVAWDAWGGDPAISWTSRIIDRLDADTNKSMVEGLLTPRQRVLYDKYEWAAETFGPWDGGIGPDGAHYIPAADNVFAEKGIICANCAFYEGGGGCEILSMPVEPDAACKLWIIPQGLVEGEPPVEATKRISRDSRFLQKAAHQRFTLGPLYVPDFMDAHGEWTDSEELQQAVWGWVRSGDRTIYLQHDRQVRAGEWVEVMTMPQPWTVEMLDGSGNEVGKVTYPAGTVFLGVIWDEEPWRRILDGQLRGYSIGGFSDRVLADLPEEAARDGIEMA